MMVITGQSGMGKSALIARVLRECYERGDLCLFVNSAQLQAFSDVQLVRHLLGLADAVPLPFVAANVFWNAIDRECARRGRRMIVAIDAINESSAPLQLLDSLDQFGRTLRESGWHRIRVLVSSRPEVWRRGVGMGRVRMKASNSAYHVTNQRIDHVLDRYSEGEAEIAIARYTKFFRVAVDFAHMSLLQRSQLRDPLLLTLTCTASQGQPLPSDLDSGKLFEALEARLRHDGVHGDRIVATIDSLDRAMFDDDGELVERDSVVLDGELRESHSLLFDDLTGEIGQALRDLNVLRVEGGRVRFTYDRYAEYRLSERLLTKIRARLKGVRPAARAKTIITIIRKNLANSFRLTTLFRALRRTLRVLAESEPKFLAILRELASDERGLALVVSVMGALAMRGGATMDGGTLVAQVLQGMQDRVDAARAGVPFPVVDIVHRLILDEEYAAWRRRDAELREAHEDRLYARFEWSIQHPKLAVSTAAVQYLFFLWQNPAGREHAARITQRLVAKAPAMWKLVSGRQRVFLQNLTGCFMLALSEARGEREAAPILELARALFRAIDPHRSYTVRVVGTLLPGLVRDLFVKRILETNENPVNYDAFRTLFRDQRVQAAARRVMQLLRSSAAWDDISAEDLLQLAQTPNAVSLQTLCFALSVRWERLARDEDVDGQAVHLELLRQLFDRGTSSTRYCIAIALYHINYFGAHATEDSVRLMGVTVDTILRVDRGRFTFPGGDRQFNTNVIGTYGRVLALHGDLIADSRTIAARPILAFAIEMLRAAKRTRRFDDYAYVCENVGLLGTLTRPRNVFDVIAYVLDDLQPGYVAIRDDLERVPLPDTWTADQRERLRAAIMTGLANIRVLYRAEVDRWILDVLEDQALYTRIATQEKPDFRITTFYSWTSEHLMYLMLTRYHSEIGEVYLDALDKIMHIGKPGQGIHYVVTALLARLHELAWA